MPNSRSCHPTRPIRSAIVKVAKIIVAYVGRMPALRRMELTEKVAATPEQPGVYLFKDAMGAVIYVGKANLLRHRLKSYFLDSRILADAKTGSLVREIADVETIVVDNEKEALALENNLIKRHKPRFNILLRDDKTYPYIRYTAFEKFPRV